MNQVNNDLAHDNPSLMFVTLFLGILNIVTGELEYCNGGHNPPYHISADGVTPLATTDGIALGVLEGFSFASRMTRLAPGETLFVFTDGVTEAMNGEGGLFSETRLERTLAGLGGEPVRRVTEQIGRNIEAFVAGAEQTDDITMLVLRYLGPGK